MLATGHDGGQACNSSTWAEAILVRSAFYAGTLGAALAAWLPFMAVGGWALYTWAIAAGVLS